MLKSKFDKDTSGFSAQKIFTDRKEPGDVLYDSLKEINDAPLKVITYYGKGGIGKTRLLKEMFLKAKENCDKIVDGIVFYPVFISLDAYDYANPINILTTIRNSINADCSLFDYAMTLYCAKAKLDIKDIRDKQWNLSKNVIEHINVLLSIATFNAAIPVKWIDGIVDKIKDHRLRAKYEKEIKCLSGLSEFDIFERLPHYLGLCLQQASEENRVHIIFMDSYDSLLVRTFSQTPSVDCDEWLRELFLSSEKLRLVIASRDKLKWEEQNDEWGQSLDQHLLKNLSDEDARWFLHNVPIDNEDIVNFIVRNSEGVPLYLDMCVDVYESLYNIHKENLTIDIFRRDGNFYSTRGKIIIDRYLRHMTSKQHDAIKILCVLHSFSRSFAMDLLLKMGLPFYSDEMSDLLDKSIIISIDEISDMWKLDESIRDHIWNCLSKDSKENLVSGVLALTVADKTGRYFQYYATVLERIIGDPSLAKDKLVTFLEQVEIYTNGGFWNEIHGLLSSQVDNADQRIKTIAVIGEAISLRRFGRLEEASSLLKSHPLNAKALGSFSYYYAYLKASISHLQGHYDQAIKAYAGLIDEMNLIKGSIPLHIYVQAALKRTDLLMLKGQFAKALRQIDKILEKELTPTDEVEALRIKGHIYRFHNDYKKARIIYESAMSLMEESKMRASIGKLYTNYVESNCFDQPEQAIAYFEEAEKYNKDNDIELAKCYAAVAIAWCMQGSMKQSADYVSLSSLKAKSSGYRAGMVFVLSAKALLDHKSNKKKALSNDLKKLDTLTQELGVYEFIYRNTMKLCGK